MSATKYFVVNPRGIPPELNGERIPIFRQGERRWYEGDFYDGDSPDAPRARGFLETATERRKRLALPAEDGDGEPEEVAGG